MSPDTTDVVDTIARRLSDAEHVLAVTNAPGNLMHTPRQTRHPWSALSLSDGNPALALFFAELTAEDTGHRDVLHAYLSAGLEDGSPLPETTLFNGPCALTFAAHAAAVGTGGYATLLEWLDEAVVAKVRQQARTVHAHIADGVAIATWSGYDVVTGISGTGRLLLARHGVTGDPATGEALTEVLTTLVETALADAVVADGRAVPAWWVTHSPTATAGHITEHLNLGLAHGVAGPLALLALALRAGVRVPRHEEAITRIVDLLWRWRKVDEHGPYWPDWVTPDQYDGTAPPGPRIRDAWCYGAAGIARALYLAGAAVGNNAWQEDAHHAFHGVIATDGGAIGTASLCHGRAGLLQIALRMSHDSGLPQYRSFADALAARLTAEFDPEKPFGYHYLHPVASLGPDRPGFLEGAAGIALALHGYAIGRPPATGWDAALLLS
ncbi:MAG TPA: lanthionine synthetase C family protein [Amycolatopsis sp.]|uniref:lanthionine synthetase C family protein n=1 Tax=Amycolatopsis sp. TaxID=37632 RepID=UPI002B49569D|nr:lanthionine synthetase C family protein [Amycolatopsis sp.]HKS46106.1 lanthionine synthetase C family protein [Amycolatopsis sp.]